jgi:hypothetical protein
MDMSNVANWFGVLGGVALITTWLLRLLKWLRTRLVEAEALADFAGRLVSELLNNATSAVKRADIHAFVQFRSTQIEADRTRLLLIFILMSFAIAPTLLFLIFILRHGDFTGAQWKWWVFAVFGLILSISYVSALFLSYQIRRIDTAWQSTARDILTKNALQHVIKKSSSDDLTGE